MAAVERAFPTVRESKQAVVAFKCLQGRPTAHSVHEARPVSAVSGLFPCQRKVTAVLRSGRSAVVSCVPHLSPIRNGWVRFCTTEENSADVSGDSVSHIVACPRPHLKRNVQRSSCLPSSKPLGKERPAADFLPTQPAPPEEASVP